jgi:hypothetical protein
MQLVGTMSRVSNLLVDKTNYAISFAQINSKKLEIV